MEESIVIETNRINYNLLSKQLHKPLCFTFHWMRQQDSNLQHAQSKCAVLPVELYLNMVLEVGLEPTRNIIPLVPKTSVFTNFTTHAFLLSGADSKIRTCDLLLPRQAE